MTATSLVIVGMAWGALAFGAVYEWAYWPLATVAATTAGLGLFMPARIGWRDLRLSALAVSLSLLLSAILLQLIPLNLEAVRLISPDAPSIVAAREFPGQWGDGIHPLSIDPSQTLRGLLVLAAMCALVIGASRLFSITGTLVITRAITALGVVMALAGIIQRPLFNGQIYGFWSPLEGGNPFGPFVNRNHFAGWMLMALPVTIALLCGEISRHRERPGWRDRWLWLASPAASRLWLLTGSAALMTLSLVLTTSRSGIAAGTLAVIGTALASRRYGGRRRAVALALVTSLLLLVVGWAGAGTIADRFGTGQEDVVSRSRVWADAVGVFQQYPLAGTGFNTYDVAMVFYQRFDKPLRYSRAHNDYLQLAAEGGLLLIVPAAICAVMLARGVRRRFVMERRRSAYWARRGAVVGILAVALQDVADFSLQMPGNAFLFAVLCAIALHRTPDCS